MANIKVVFNASLNDCTEELYLVGSIAQLGAWDLSKAIKMHYNNELNKFSISKMLPVNESFEYKFLRLKSWSYVEKGISKEELSNRKATTAKGLVIDDVVYQFAN